VAVKLGTSDVSVCLVLGSIAPLETERAVRWSSAV